MNEKFTVPNELKGPLEKQEAEDTEALKSELAEQKKKLIESEETISEMEEKIVELSKNGLPKYIDASLKLWLEPQHYKFLPDGLGIVDPVYGYITLEKELVPLLMHPLIQRLNFVKQLSFSYLEFPTAHHTRLSHSLGVCKNAELALDAIFRHGKVYSPSGENSIAITAEDRRKLFLEAKVVALLHDVGHAPFGHCVDRLVGFKMDIPYYGGGHFDKYFSSLYTQKFLGDLLKNLGFDPVILKDILGPDKTNLSGYHELVSQIIDSALDVDRMDYLVRDAHLSGLPIGFVNSKELIESIRPFVRDDHYSITYSMESLYHIEHFLYARDAMYVNCYESPKKTAAEGMIVSAISDFNETFKVPLENLVLLGDYQLLSTLIRYAPPSMPCSKLALKIVRGDIFSQVYELPLLSDQAQKNPEIKNFIEDMARPEKRVTVFLQRPTEWREILAKGAGFKVDSWKILITVPPLDAYHPKEIGVNLLCKNDSGYGTVNLAEKSDFANDFLRIQTKARLKLRVFASSDLSATQREKVRDVAKKNFEAPA